MTCVSHACDHFPQNDCIVKLINHELLSALIKNGVTKNFLYWLLKFHLIKITRAFTNIDWGKVRLSPTFDDMVDKFNSVFLHTIQSCVKFGTRFVQSETLPPWLDEEVKQASKQRDKFKARTKLQKTFEFSYQPYSTKKENIFST